MGWGMGFGLRACIITAAAGYVAFDAAREAAALRTELRSERARSVAAVERLSARVAALEVSCRARTGVGPYVNGASATKRIAEPNAANRDQAGQPLDAAALERVVQAVLERVDLERADGEPLDAQHAESEQAAMDRAALEHEAATRDADVRTPEQVRAFDVGNRAVDTLVRSATLTARDSRELAALTSTLHDEDRQSLRRRLSAAINAGQLRNEADDLPF